MYDPPLSFLPSSFKEMITYVPHTLLMIHKPPEIGCKILSVFVYFSFLEKGSFLYVSKGIPDLEYIKVTSSALAETNFDPKDKGFPPWSPSYSRNK